MGPDAVIVRRPEELLPFAAAWNRLPETRGIQADLYDTYAWFGAWLAVAGFRARHKLRVPLVIQKGEPAALLPLRAVSHRRWEAAGLGFRPRYRVIAQGPDPGLDLLFPLAESVARAGVKELILPAMPTRDPATFALAQALEFAGFRVTRREGSVECLSVVANSWTDHSRQFKKYERTVKNFANKAARLGPVEFELYGPGGKNTQEGFARYLELHARGWKGALAEPMAGHRRELLARAASLARLYLLKVAGVPAAAIIWFRMGEAAFAYSTVYDERMAALSPGTVAMWEAHEALFSEGPLRLLDYLPGRGSQKDQLGTDRSPLVTLEGRRSSLWISLVRPLRRPLSAARLLLPRRRKKKRLLPAPILGAERAFPAAAGASSPLAARLELAPAVELFLAVNGGHASVKAMTDRWESGDEWWLVGEPPRAAVRLGTLLPAGRRVREIVWLSGSRDGLPGCLGQLAAATGQTLLATLPPAPPGAGRPAVPMTEAFLPWPGSLPER